jgi:hypothetical protein
MFPGGVLSDTKDMIIKNELLVMAEEFERWLMLVSG